MDLSERLVLLKSSAKEEDYPTFTTEDVIFWFEDVAHPEGVILNLSDPSECHVLSPLWISLICLILIFWVGVATMFLSIR